MDLITPILLLTTMVLFILKAVGVISTSWLIVFIPLLIYLAIFILVLVGLLIFGKALINKKKDPKLDKLYKEYKKLTKGWVWLHYLYSEVR